MKKILFSFMSALMSIAAAQADEFTVSNITIPQGGTVELEVNLNNTVNECVGFQFQLCLPEGLTVKKNASENFVFSEGVRMNEKGFETKFSWDTDHYQILSYNTDLKEMDGTSGTIISISLMADAELELGTILDASLKGCKMTNKSEESLLLNDAINFTITIGEPVIPTVLDENSTIVPEAAENVDIIVNRTIKANEWSTICLPFDMTEEQTKEVFGEDVQLAEFVDYEPEYDGNNVVGITVNFTDIDLTEGFYGNYPYLIKVSKDINSFALNATINPKETEAVAEYDNGKSGKQHDWYGRFIGTYHAGDFVPANSLFLNGNKFYYSAGMTKIKAFRAYFTFKENLKLTSVEEGGEAKIRFQFENNNATAIQTIAANAEDNVIYSINGVRMGTADKLKALPKGLYIVNGKKVIIK